MSWTSTSRSNTSCVYAHTNVRKRALVAALGNHPHRRLPCGRRSLADVELAKAIGFRHTEYVGRSCSMQIARCVTTVCTQSTTLHVGSGLAVYAESGSECHARWVIRGGMYPRRMVGLPAR